MDNDIDCSNGYLKTMLIESSRQVDRTSALMDAMDGLVAVIKADSFVARLEMTNKIMAKLKESLSRIDEDIFENA